MNYVIILASTFIKLPQLYKIVTEGSIEGISQFSALLEYLCYFNTMAYAKHLNLPQDIYAETAVVSLQTGITLLVILQYEKAYTNLEKMLMTALLATYSFILVADIGMTADFWNAISGSTIFVSLFCRWS